MIIYQIKNKINGKTYIGKTIRPMEDRWKQHYRRAKTGKSHIACAIRKYGKDGFDITILEQNILDLNTLNEREIYWIDKMNPEYNMTKGGDGGDTGYRNTFVSEEVRKKISATLTGRKMPYVSESNRRRANPVLLFGVEYTHTKKAMVAAREVHGISRRIFWKKLKDPADKDISAR